MKKFTTWKLNSNGTSEEVLSLVLNDLYDFETTANVLGVKYDGIITQELIGGAYKISTDGTIDRVQPRGKYFTLKELQDQVKGYVEAIQLPFGTMIVNEEGILKDLERNKIASIIYKKYCNYAGFIVGDVLIVDDRVLKYE